MQTATRPYVLALVGSRRRRNTWRIVESLRPFQNGAGFALEVESLYDREIRDCVGFHRCVEGGDCGIRDGMPALMARLEGAAGVVLASPVYMCGVSGRIKTAIDRTAAWFHRPVLAGKPGLALVTTAGSYEKDALRYLATVEMHWGLLYSGGATRKAGAHDEPLSAREVAAFVRTLREGAATFRPGFRQLALFQVQKVLAQKILPVDRAYWKEHGWDRRVFSVDCRAPLWKRIIAWTFYRLLYARVKGFDAEEEVPKT
jgi:multimeric flavodoxin WrbA